MPDLNLPRSIPAATAAAIACVSRRTFRRRYGASVQFDDRDRVLLSSLETALGREITSAVYLAAERSRDRDRAAERQRRHAQEGIR